MLTIMNKKEFALMFASMFKDFVDNKVLRAETEAVYDPYSGNSEPNYEVSFYLDRQALEEYLKTL